MKSLDRITRGYRALAGALLAASTVFGCTTEQPKTRCTTAHGPFALKFTKVSGTGACGELKGGTAGVNSYWRPNGSSYSVTKGPVAIKSEEIGALLEEYGQDADSKDVVALGAFKTDDPGADNFCEVEMAQPANLKLAAVPAMDKGDAGMTDPKPAVDISLKWSDVKFYVTAAQPGTMFTGRLEYAKTVGTEAPCSATYDVVGLWPAVGCEGTIMGQDGKPTGSGKPDDVLCDPCSDPMNGRPTGSGISPTVDISCDATTLTCMPKSAVPSLLSTAKKCDAI
jgi:hypothetical protein